MQDDPRQHAGPIPAISGYRDLALIADGGFSSVYTARQERFDRTVAVKVLHADIRDAEAQRRFADECRLTGRLSGEPHIITVFDAGTTEDGRPYLAMQYLPGGSLADRLASSGPLAAREAARIGAAVAAALAAAHEAHILHRDIKPGNILMSAGNEPVLSDFGVAGRYRPAAILPDAAEDAFTPAHTAPEVREGQASSVASDIYSLGSTLYTLLAGTPPFADAADQADLLARIRAGSFPDLERADLPGGLMALIRRCLAYEPARRPASARHLAADLAAFQIPAGNAPPADRLTGGTAAESGRELPGALAQGAPGRPTPEEPTRLRPERVRSGAAVSGPRRGRRATMTAIAVAAALAVVAMVGVAIASIIPSPPRSRVSASSTASSTATSRPPTTAPAPSPATTRPPSTAPAPSPAAPSPAPPVPPPATPPPATASPSPPPTAPAGTVHMIGKPVVLNSASGHGCTAWMNERNPGSEVQGLVQSWGNDCTMWFRQSTDGGRSFSTVAQENHVVSAAKNTSYYWTGGGRYAEVCLDDASSRQHACGTAIQG